MTFPKPTPDSERLRKYDWVHPEHKPISSHGSRATRPGRVEIGEEELPITEGLRAHVQLEVRLQV